MALSEAQYLAHQSKIDWEVLADLDKEKYIKMAKKNVKLALILDKIRETDVKSQLTDQEVFELIKDNLTRSKVQTSLDEVMKELGRTGMLQILMQRIKDENTLDYVVKTVKVLE
jgi:FKBP-type peptidyl-prolyl cis-trans isomerase (trigger factor)